MDETTKQLFADAAELSAGERAAFVERACAGDRARQRRLLLLLRAHDEAGDGFLEHPTGLVEAAALDAVADGDELVLGERIGAYVLESHLGRGGFGSVFRARQEEPVQRDVALKVLHAGFDSGRVMRRFLAERQALARMSHPSIAKVFDAGVLPAGRPWLAMELVDGEPITVHADAHGLDLRARLRLFTTVCHAVQHAHGKGVVHRDLKPSNVLVAERDQRPHPLIIDFGIARALDAEDGEITLSADGPQLLGTPDYMSPEQAAGDRDAIDTRTDVYSLGVILYELAAGQRPFARPSGPAGLQDLLRAIREDDPPPPSRRADPSRRLPAELDWITARAMARNPAARYATAAALADDVERLLRDEPVLAGPPSAAYRLAKFARRHRLAVAAAATALLSLGLGTFAAVRGFVDARAAERLARQDQLVAEQESRKANRALDLLDQLWESANPARFMKGDYPARELFADFERELPRRTAGEPEVEQRLRRSIGRLQRILGMPASAAQHTERAVALARTQDSPARLAAALLEHGRVVFDGGDVPAAAAAAEEALALAPADPGMRADLLELQANCRLRQGDAGAALAAAEAALALRTNADDPAELARSQMQLAAIHGNAGRAETAMQHLQQALATLEPLGDGHPDALVALQHLAFLQQRQGDATAAEATFRESLARRRELYDEDHPLVAWAEADLGWLLQDMGRPEEAEALLRHALAALRQRLGADHLYVTEAMQRLGAVTARLGRTEAATALLQDAAQRFRTLPGHPPDGLVGCLGNISSLAWQRGDRAGARAVQQEALEVARRELPDDHFVLSVTMTNLGTMLAELGELEAARELFAGALQRSTAAGRAGESRIQRERLALVLERLGRSDEAAAVRAAK